MQNGQPVVYASRSLTETLTGCSYVSQMEKEPLAIVFGIEKFEPYRYGRTFKVETDHKQLESILIIKKNFLSALKRLERMMLCLKNFDFEVEYKKGIYPIHLAERTSTWPGQVFILQWTLELLLSKMLKVLMRWVSMYQLALRPCQSSASNRGSGEMVLLKTVIQTWWPDTKEEVPLSVQEYFHFRDELHVNMQNIPIVDGFTSRETQGLSGSQVVTQLNDIFDGEDMLMGKLHLQVPH